MGKTYQEVHSKTPFEPHVLLFPIPFQGPVNCFLKLAELLCVSGIHVTFLNNNHIHGPLLRHTQVLSRFSRYPNFRFETIPDGLEHENPVSGDRFQEVMDAIDVVTKPLFREMIVSGSLSRRSKRPVTVMIVDGVFSFAAEVGFETSTPVLSFETISPCCLWTSYFHLHNLIEVGHLPFKGNDLDEPIKIVVGTEHVLRKRDLAEFCRKKNLSDPEIQRTLKEAKTIPRTQGLILNTFEELDGLILSHMRKLCPNIYTIGPLHSLHEARLIPNKSPKTSFSNSIWKEDQTCLSWLDKFPSKTVVYVSIGSMATLTFDQMLEVWHGLVNSNKPFLWVRRPGSITCENNESIVPNELLEYSQKMGCIIDWAPQEDVLAHRAIGGFLTHSGWNSTLESIVQGIPMICRPFYVDQLVNSRFVGEVWKAGIDVKDTCDRLIIEKAVRDIMDVKRDVFTQTTNTWANLAKESISETGSSSISLSRLIDDIRVMTSTMK
uniref:7-deoxyloganetic acid glucosyltransferase-like n=1 Tax=Erigeron canadensis TaxID=72917 RepID=UPI001CB95745|nr:7-deoxyloganetic acid glucosyltransferase-like [Erigeron canadensis]